MPVAAAVALEAIQPRLPANQETVGAIEDFAGSICSISEAAASIAGEVGDVEAVLGGVWKNGATPSLFDDKLDRFDLFVNAAIHWQCPELWDLLETDRVVITADAEQRFREALEQLQKASGP